MKFAFTPFDKAIVAAIAGPIIVYVTTYLNGAEFDPKVFAGAVIAGAFAGLAVYLKGNSPPTG